MDGSKPASRRGRIDRSDRTPVTAYDVADLAGVSQSAVSRAFTSGASISPAKRSKVLAAAESLGYRPNMLARSLTTRRSSLVGLAVGNLENSFFTTLLDAVSSELSDADLRLLMFTARTNAQVDAQIDELLRYRIDALILLSTFMSPALAEQCETAGIRTIFVNRDPDQIGGGCALSGADAVGGRAIGGHLLDRGYRRIAFMSGVPQAASSRAREAALTGFLAQQGLPPPMLEIGQFKRAGAAEAMHRLLDRADRPDAVFCANDHMACSAIDVLRERGLRPGADIGIAGFDDIPMAAWPGYDLTTYSVSVARLAREIVRFVRDYDDIPAADRRLIIPGELILRGSTRR